MKIRTHNYAERAYLLVEQVRKDAKLKDAQLQNKYRTLALTFPAMIMQSGLAQAVGFLKAKGKPEHTTMLEHLASLLGYTGDNATKKLYESILSSDLTQYQLMTRNALESSAWLRRYAQALLEKQK